MKYILIIAILALIPGDIDKIAKVNKLKQEAKEAYLNGDYETALSKYQYLTDSLGVKDDNISLNLANAYYNTKDTAQAINGYSSLLNSSSKLIRSTANQQLGVISTRNKKFKEALDHFKEALRADPANEDARYNYEMMKKILEEQEKQQQQNQQNQDQQDQKDQQQNQDQQQQQQNQEGQDQDEQNQQQDEQQQEQEGESEQEQEQQEGKEQEQEQQEGEQKEQEQQEQQEGEESDEKKQEEQANSISEKLEEMKISEEKAKMILEALKNKEIQYYQQTKKKPTKRKDPNKPDW